MASDLKRELSLATGVLHADGVADRATFVVDPNNEVRFVSVGPHEKTLRHADVSRTVIFEAIRLASIVSGVAQALQTADVLAEV